MYQNEHWIRSLLLTHSGNWVKHILSIHLERQCNGLLIGLLCCVGFNMFWCLVETLLKLGIVPVVSYTPRLKGTVVFQYFKAQKNLYSTRHKSP